MEVDYEINRDDLIEFNRHVTLVVRGLRQQLITKVVFVAAAFAVLGIYLLSQPDRTLFLMGCGLLGMAVTFPILVPWRQMRSFNSQLDRLFPKQGTGAMYGWRHSTIDAAGLMQIGELIAVNCKWQGIERIESTDRQLMFFIGPAFAYIIPRRAFPDETAYRSFVETAERFQRAAPPRA